MSTEPCRRCGGTQVLKYSGRPCPECTHIIDWPVIPHGRRVLVHRVSCSCGWSHSETARQNALGRAAKMRGAVNAHLKAVGEI